jgi:DNA-binding transcriptional LysR family regulator
MRFIDPQLLYTFVKLAHAGQFTKAADQIGLSQSAVSQQIQKLEQLLGAPLIERSKKNVTLTPQGQELLGKAEKLLLQHESLLTEFNQSKITGRIRFGSPEDFATLYLPSILTRFSALYPNVLIEVNCELTLKLLESYENGGYDIIVFKQEPSHQYQHAVSLWEEPLVWTVGKNYNLEQAVQDGKVKLVLSPQPCVYRSRAIEALEKQGIAWEQVYTSPSLTGTLAAVRAGLGVTVLPVTSVPPDLLHVPPAHHYLLPLEATQIKLLTVPNPSQAIQVFEKFIQESLSSTESNYYSG